MEKDKHFIYRNVGTILTIIGIIGFLELIITWLPSDYGMFLIWPFIRIIIQTIAIVVGVFLIRKYQKSNMNFKLNPIKIIISIIVFILIDLLLSFQIDCFPMPGGSCTRADNILLGSPAIFLFSLILAVIVYFLLSIFQKK
jgi:hypothetical protein